MIFSQERDAPPPPPPQATTKDPTEYRGMASSTSYEGHGAPPPPAHFLSAPMGFVGGSAATTPSHGPNQIFVNNVSRYNILIILLTNTIE